MKTIFFIFFAIASLGVTAQEVDSRSIPDLKPIAGVATYEQFFAVQKCLNTGVQADTTIRDVITGTYTLSFAKHNVKVLRVSEKDYQKYLAKLVAPRIAVVKTSKQSYGKSDALVRGSKESKAEYEKLVIEAILNIGQDNQKKFRASSYQRWGGNPDRNRGNGGPH